MNSTAEHDVCPLCRSAHPDFFHRDAMREYWQCRACRLVFVPRRFWLSRNEEKAVYDLHHNDAADEGYRRFLSRLVAPMLERLGDDGRKGLDFGCGPGPALSQMFQEHGHRVALFDPFYCNDPSLLLDHYDFICATEVVEHLQEPAREFERLFAMLHSGGWLGIMTKQVVDREAFRSWHYIRDLTHICFFSRETFDYLANRFAANRMFAGSDVIIFQTRE